MNRRAPPEPSHVRGWRPSSTGEEIEQTWRIRFLQEGVMELEDMFSPNLFMMLRLGGSL